MIFLKPTYNDYYLNFYPRDTYAVSKLIKHFINCRRKNLYYLFLLLLMFHSFVLGVYFLVYISVLCQLPVLYLLYLFAYRIHIVRT